MHVTALPPVKFQITPKNDIFHTKKKEEKENSQTAKARRLGWDILSVVVFPIGLGRLVGRVVNKVASDLILPAAKMFNLNRYAEDAPEFEMIDLLHEEREEFLKNQ